MNIDDIIFACDVVSQHWTSDEVPQLIEAVRILREVKAAGFINENGEVRKVLGTLPITADGVIVPLFKQLWFIDRHATKNADGDYFSALARALPTATTASDGMLEYRASDGMDVCWVSECYSTREAAEAAKGGGK